MIGSLSYFCHGNFSLSSVHPALKVWELLSHYCSVCCFYIVIRGKKKKEEKSKEGWTWSQGIFVVVVSTVSFHLYLVNRQCAVAFVQPEVLRVSMLHGCKTSLKCPKCVRISIFFSSCSRKNFEVPVAYHSHRVAFILWLMEECSFCGAGTALVQVFHKGFRDALLSSVCVFWISICLA